jgi:hypothetical protein
MTMIFAAVHESVVVKGFGALPRERVRSLAPLRHADRL